MSLSTKNGISTYIAKIHINGDYIIGRYSNEEDAAIAYNKAGELLKNAGIIHFYQKNYIESLSPIQYAAKHASVKISKKIRDLVNSAQ